VLSRLPAIPGRLLLSPYTIYLDVPARFWFLAACPELLGACSLACGFFPASPSAWPALPEACSTCTGCALSRATLPELFTDGENPLATRAASYSFAYSPAAVFQEKSLAIPFNWMRFHIRSSI